MSEGISAWVSSGIFYPSTMTHGVVAVIFLAAVK